MKTRIVEYCFYEVHLYEECLLIGGSVTSFSSKSPFSPRIIMQSTISPKFENSMIIYRFFTLATFISQALSLQPPHHSLGKEHSLGYLSPRTRYLPRLEPLSYVNTTRLQVAYYEDGPSDGQVVLLLHGWPYDIHSYTEVAPALVKRGYRVIVPYLRGNGPTTFLHTDTFRSGQQAALGYDIMELLDALSIKKAIFAGYDWGGRGACVAAALWPKRCAGLVSVNSYLIQDLSKAWVPLDAKIEAGFWYFYYFLTPRGQAALAEHPKDIARVVWNKNSPEWNYTEADLDRAAETFVNPDYVSIVTHVYRHRLLYAPGDPDYSDIEKELLKQPVISVPTVTLDGLADGNFPPTNGSSSAKYFSGPHVHHQVPGAGHNLPQEKPEAFVNAVLEVSSLK
jgi:pimeloyl-ACP methyl ester carboxylesterase